MSDSLTPGAAAPCSGRKLGARARKGLTNLCVTSAYPPIATVSRPSRHFVFLPLADSFTATNSPARALQMDWARPSASPSLA
jgi:hypothetical protein